MPADRKTFHAKIQSASLADIQLVQFENAPVRNDIAARHIAHAIGEEILVRRQIAGGFVGEQEGREALLESGDMVLFDPRRPMHGKYLSNARQLVLKVPRRELEARVGDVRGMLACPIKPA